MNSLDEDPFEIYGAHQADKVPKISVIVSTYNRFRREGECENLLKRSIHSILNQSFKDFELVLIDDSSKDDTKEYCKQLVLQDPRLRFFHFKKNSGLPAKRYNFGMAVSRGAYITFMFDDDHWETTALQDLYEGITKTHKECAMVYGFSEFVRVHDGFRMVLGGKWKWKAIDETNYIANQSVIVRRNAIDLVGGYDEDPIFLRICDWDLWWRIGRKFSVASINKKIGTVYGELSDSIGMTKALYFQECKKRQREPRCLPLQINSKEPLKCKIHSFWFDRYILMYPRLIKIRDLVCQFLISIRLKVTSVIKNGYFQCKMKAKEILPDPIYQALKRIKNGLMRCFWLLKRNR